MRRLRRAAIGVTALVAATSISVTRRRTLEAVDAFGGRVEPVYVGYSYIGHLYNPAHSTTYWAKPFALARSDSSDASSR